MMPQILWSHTSVVLIEGKNLGQEHKHFRINDYAKEQYCTLQIYKQRDYSQSRLI